jgi:hypothetical protein
MQASPSSERSEASSPPSDDEFLGAAKAALGSFALKALSSRKLARLMVDVLANRQLQPFGDAIVADRLT